MNKTAHKSTRLFLISLSLLLVSYLAGNTKMTTAGGTELLSPLAEEQPIIITHVEAKEIPQTPKEKIMAAWGPTVGPKAVKVAFCESSLNPRARHHKSSAKGLFQIINTTWKGYNCTGDPLNAEDNINCAYKIYQANAWGSTASWAASKPCWEAK